MFLMGRCWRNLATLPLDSRQPVVHIVTALERRMKFQRHLRRHGRRRIHHFGELVICHPDQVRESMDSETDEEVQAPRTRKRRGRIYSRLWMMDQQRQQLPLLPTPTPGRDHPRTQQQASERSVKLTSLVTWTCHPALLKMTCDIFENSIDEYKETNPMDQL